jgi:uncharacterized protein (UPF0335 family)
LTRRARAAMAGRLDSDHFTSGIAIMSDSDVAKNTPEVNAAHLRAFIERIERLEEEKKALSDDIRDVYAEAKGNGFDAKVLRKIVSIRKQDRDKRREEEEILDLYLSALGMS